MMGLLKRRRRDRARHARRHEQLRLALAARRQLQVAFDDESANSEVLAHVLDAGDALDDAIATLSPHALELQGEFGQLRPLIAVPDRLPEEIK